MNYDGALRAQKPRIRSFHIQKLIKINFFINFSGAQCAYNHVCAFIMHDNRFPGERRYLVRTRLGYFFISAWSLITFWKNQCFEINILNALILAEISSKHKRYLLLLYRLAHTMGVRARIRAETTHVLQSYSKMRKASFVDVNVLALGARATARATL